jgi:hypothetical protein
VVEGTHASRDDVDQKRREGTAHEHDLRHGQFRGHRFRQGVVEGEASHRDRHQKGASGVFG